MKFPRYVYVIEHTVTKKIYVGSSANVEQRIKLHLSELRRGTHKVEDMQYDFNTYGENFSFTIVDRIDNWNERNKEYKRMVALESNIRGKGYNYKDGCKGGNVRREIRTNRYRISSVYPNLNIEIERANVTLDLLALKIGLTPGTISEKFNGKRPITLSEAKQIKAIIKTDLPLEILFSKEPL